MLVVVCISIVMLKTPPEEGALPINSCHLVIASDQVILLRLGSMASTLTTAQILPPGSIRCVKNALGFKRDQQSTL